jgi:CheY-like chemotaxis protein
MPLGGTISVAAKNIDVGDNDCPPLACGKYVRLSFADTGVGIPADILPRIFDPFFTTKSKGHGLGLATCFSIVKRHDGIIQARSEPGNGSTFDIYLPASSGAAARETSRHGAAHIGCGDILVMDDEEVMRDSVGEMLKKFGYTPEFAANGTDALRMISRRLKAGSPFAAVILDLTIPGGLGGKETISELRRRGINVPAFVFSGYAEDPIMARPQDFGFTASIRKPFKKSELGEMLEKFMGRQEASS